MNKGTDTVQSLSNVFVNILANPPSKVGERLCSERELARQLKVERITIQRAFDHLVEKGYIARRHGSGTYVRKVPSSPIRGVRAEFNGRPILSSDLFAGPSTTPQRKRSLQEHRSLQLALIAQRNRGETRSLILNGIADRVAQLGHELKVHVLEAEISDQVTHEALTRKLHSIRCDGYILWALDVPAVDHSFLKAHPPIVYVGDNERIADRNYSPLVRVGLEDALIRALSTFADSGYTRIGYIGNYGGGLIGNARKYYENAIRNMDLKFCYSEFCEYDDSKILTQMRSMFSPANRPEAIYVADDILLRSLVRSWEKLNIVPGQDVAIITLANRGIPLPAGRNWSKMEFHPFQLGRMVIDSLLLEIQNAGEAICSVEHLAIWNPGTSHLSNLTKP